jgi:DNA-binding SARP family transcriptional activator/TolB-like protein
VIRLHTLGPLDLRGSDGQELRAILAQPKRIALLAYLALARPPGFQRRDILLALFWPENDAEHARNSLSQSVHVLRRALGDDVLVSRNGDTLSLNQQDIWCDAIAFEDALDTGKPTEAVELYRGDLLEGFHVSGASEFDQWLETERARLAGRYAKALEAVAQEREAAGDFEGSVTWLRVLAGRDPYDSRLALRLMRALAAAGDPAGAVQHARVHEALLREELDIPPDTEVAAFVRRLQSAPAESVERLPSDSWLPAPGVRSELAPAAESAVSPAYPKGLTKRERSRRRTAVVAAGLVVLFAAGAGAFALRNGAREPARPLIRSLAVLPLENLSGDSAQQPFTDGMHDLLITELARYPQLSVISRTSVLQYRGTRKPVPEIARELKVDGVVEGALLRDGERVRITTQLVHGSTDRHLWAQRYERDIRDVLLLQGELAEAIAREVNVAAKPPEKRRRSAVELLDSAPQELYLRELYLRGRHAELGLSWNGVHAAKAYYQQAIERDSTFALGYAGLSGIYGIMADYDFAPIRPALDSASMIARRAVTLDSTLPETRTALAVTLGDAGEFRAAEREFRRAIELGPSNAGAHYSYSILLVALGRGEDALREASRAAQLDPFGPRGQLAMQRYATWLLTGQRPHLKLPVAERRPILKVEPGEPWARAREGVEYAEQGRCAQAHSEIQRAQQLVPADNLGMLKFVASVFWWCGEHARARGLLARMKQRPDVRDSGFHIAWLHTLFGEKDSAFVWLEHQRWTISKLSGLSAGRWMDLLRPDPRFQQLLRRLGLRDS